MQDYLVREAGVIWRFRLLRGPEQVGGAQNLVPGRKVFIEGLGSRWDWWSILYEAMALHDLFNRSNRA
jgi:hypothetical protein